MLEDVRNSSIGLSDEYSSSGRDVPRRELYEVGINIDDERQV